MNAPSESSAAHEQAAAEHVAASGGVRCAVLTVSDTRTHETDKGGDLVVNLLSEAGMKLAERAIIRDDAAAIRDQFESWLRNGGMDAILTTGGTGIARRDTTVEVVRSMLAVEIEGFGELFRMLSWQEIGPAAMMSRAVGGLARGSHGQPDIFIFAMPGSTNAVETALTKLILPQLPHLLWERRK